LPADRFSIELWPGDPAYAEGYGGQAKRRPYIPFCVGQCHSQSSMAWYLRCYHLSYLRSKRIGIQPQIAQMAQMNGRCAFAAKLPV
jgi:hypothetical protein